MKLCDSLFLNYFIIKVVIATKVFYPTGNGV
jgi:hypothetical protein